MPTVHFLNASTNQEKLAKLCLTIQNHFNKKERILIAVSNEETAKYIDLLLWRSPAESFLPHKVAKTPLNSLVIITTSSDNLNQSKIIFNLLPTVHPHYQDYELVYEIFDTTDPTKKEISQKKHHFYQTNKVQLIQRD